MKSSKDKELELSQKLKNQAESQVANLKVEKLSMQEKLTLSEQRNEALQRKIEFETEILK